MLYGYVDNGVFNSSSIGPWSSADPGWGWDKPSDVNVVVSGTVPDGGMTLVLLGGALVGVGALRRRLNL